MSENDFGWSAHIDKTGTPCVYCSEPSTQTLVLEPDEYQAGELKRRGKRVGVCDEHNREPEQRAPADRMRRRAQGVEQLSLDTGTRPNQGNAILGDQAA